MLKKPSQQAVLNSQEFIVSNNMTNLLLLLGGLVVGVVSGLIGLGGGVFILPSSFDEKAAT